MATSRCKVNRECNHQCVTSLVSYMSVCVCVFTIKRRFETCLGKVLNTTHTHDYVS